MIDGANYSYRSSNDFRAANPSGLSMPARGDGVHQFAPVSPSPFITPAWQRERAAMLQRLFQRISRAEPGHVEEQLRMAAKTWKGRCYRNRHSRPMQANYSTLRRLYYQWKRSGEGALQLRYPTCGDPDLIPAVLAAALAVDVTTLAQVARQAGGGKPVTVYKLRASLPPGLWRGVRELLRHRRMVAQAEGRLRQEATRRSLPSLNGGGR